VTINVDASVYGLG